MKNRFFTLTAIVCLSFIFFVGCRVDDSNRMPDTTGHNMFMGWNTATADVMDNFVNIAFQFNQWLKTSDSLPNARCAYYSVEAGETNVWYLLKNDEREYRIETNGELLDSAAQWRVLKYKGNTDYYNQHILRGGSDIHYNHCSFANGNVMMEITSAYPSWLIYIHDANDASSQPSNGNWEMHYSLYSYTQEVPVTFNYLEYTLEGHGRYAFSKKPSYNEEDNGIVYLDFNIDDPLVASAERPTCWKNGVLKMTAVNGRDEVNTRTAHFKKSNDKYFVCFYKDDNPEEASVWYRY